MRQKVIFSGVIAISLLIYLQLFAAGPLVTMYKDPYCGCCTLWAKHLEANGFEVKIQEVQNMDQYKKTHGVPANIRSCHTAVVNGYTIEGHVPAEDIHRLLKEKPKAKGLGVPGMPTGSPGMEAGTTRQAYSVYLFDAEGKTSVFRQYSAR